MEVTDLLLDSFDYHLLKIEIEKIHSLCYAMNHDQSSLASFVSRIFDKDSLPLMFDVFEMIATIKPAFIQASKGTAAER
jgi:hypothetical protein